MISVKQINVKKSKYFFDDMINIKDLDSINIKIGKKSYKNIIISHIGCLTVKDVT